MVLRVLDTQTAMPQSDVRVGCPRGFARSARVVGPVKGISSTSYVGMEQGRSETSTIVYSQ